MSSGHVQKRKCPCWQNASTASEKLDKFYMRYECCYRTTHHLIEVSNTSQRYKCSFTNVISAAENSAATLVNLLARDFKCFRDEHPFDGEDRTKNIRLLKRAQILVADIWACFNGESWGDFDDIDKITMFADYRVPQILITFGALYCSPGVAAAIKGKELIESGGRWEVQLRGE